MANKPRKPAERITEFKSLASYKASTAREGDIDAPVFEGMPVRRIVHGGVPWFSVIDMISALTESDNPSSYWGKLKERMDEEGASEVLTRCQKLPLPGKDGKLYPGDCADIETLNRLVQSIPSPKVEPWKQWLARVGYERIQETAQPSQAIERAIAGFRKLGRDERWIEDRIKSIVAGEADGETRCLQGQLPSQDTNRRIAPQRKEAAQEEVLMPCKKTKLTPAEQRKRFI